MAMNRYTKTIERDSLEELKGGLLKILKRFLTEESYKVIELKHLDGFLKLLACEEFDRKSFRRLRAISKFLIGLRIPETALIQAYKLIKDYALLEGDDKLMSKIEFIFKNLYKPYLILHKLERLQDVHFHLEGDLLYQMNKLKEIYLREHKRLIGDIFSGGRVLNLDSEADSLLSSLEAYFKDSKVYSRLLSLHELYKRTLTSIAAVENDFISLYTLTKNVELIFKDIINLIDEAVISLLSETAFLDVLTGVYNRNYLQLILGKEISFCKRHNIPISVILLDVDDFKLINDKYGHDVGDLVLRFLGESIRRIIRSSDISVRYGGEEFLILLPFTSLEGAYTAGEKIRAYFESKTFTHNSLSITITISAGVAQIKNFENPWYDIKRADKALYMAKSLGKNRVMIASDDI